MTDTSHVWKAVDRLTLPTRVRVQRDPDATPDYTPHYADRCRVDQHTATTEAWAEVPSLWDQSTAAIAGAEHSEGGGSPKHMRNLADLDLMEIRSLIRDTTRAQLVKLHQAPPVAYTWESWPVPQQIRRLVSTALALPNPDHEFIEYRFSQWARVLEAHLRAGERVVKPVRLRNSACPKCRARQVTIDQDGEMVVVPALVVDFHDGYVRAAVCSACQATWFRGTDLEDLAEQIGAPALGQSA